MPSDLNLAIVDGVLNEEPELIQLKSAKLLRLIVKSTERFRLSSARGAGEHHSFIPIEILGKNAEIYTRTLVVGRMYRFKGYLRTDPLGGQRNVLRLRCVNIEPYDVDRGEQ